MLKEQAYFYNDFEQCVVRTNPLDDNVVEYWIKYKGGVEFKGTPQVNNNIYETVHIYSESITEKQYNGYWRGY